MIRQFDLVANPDPGEAVHRPYLVVLQSDLIWEIKSTIVAPLVGRQHLAGARRLNPIVVVDGREYWLATHELFAIERSMLREKSGNLAEQRDTIIAALDLLFTGV